MLGFKFEPALISEAIRQVLLALILFQVVQWTDQQVAGILMAVSAVLALFTRQASIPVATIERSDTSVREIKAQAAANEPPYTKGPDIKSLVIWLLAGSMAVSSCATMGGARHRATVSIVSAHAVLSAVQDTEATLVCGRAGAPAPPTCVPEQKHKELSAKLAQAFGYDAQVARIIRAMPAGSPQPAEVSTLLAQIAGLINQILADLPQEAPQTAALVQRLEAK